MFGYVIPQKEELKLRELAVYQAYYCGVCRSIGRCSGELAKAVLSYDCSFWSLMLSGMNGCAGMEQRRCVYKPHKKRDMAVESEEVKFGADLNVLLATCKLKDDWTDEHKIGALLEDALLRPARCKVELRRPELAEVIQDGIARLSELERSACWELDAPADVFAGMMRDVAWYAPVQDGRNAVAFSHVMYHLGRWIYLMDAWDDREKDGESGAFNPFLSANAGRDRAEFLISCSINEAINAYELIDFKSHKGILDNIIYEGCTARAREVLGGKDEQPL